MINYKKISTIIMSGALALSLGTGALANGPIEKENKEKIVDVSLSITSEQEFEFVYVGDTVDLQAVTPKHGSTYKDKWTVYKDGRVVDLTLDHETVLTDVDGVNSYISTTTFDALEAGTYTLKYSIEMAAGKSHVRFAGEEESDDIVVKNPETAYITGVTVKNYRVTSQGSNFRAAGDIYFTMSNGDDTQLAQSFSNIVLNNGNSYTNTVEILAGEQIYKITVTKTGWILN